MCALREDHQIGETHLGIIDIRMARVGLKVTVTGDSSRKKEKGAQVRYTEPDI